MVIIGWKLIDSTEHWICSNSWGEGYGDNGLCYVPMSHDSLRNELVVWDADSPETPPANITQNVDSTTETAIFLYWDAVPNAIEYNVYHIWDSNPDNVNRKLIKKVARTSAAVAKVDLMPEWTANYYVFIAIFVVTSQGRVI